MDLLREWDAVMGGVAAKMLTWIDQVGFPLLTVKAEAFSADEVTMTINQR